MYVENLNKMKTETETESLPSIAVLVTLATSSTVLCALGLGIFLGFCKESQFLDALNRLSANISSPALLRRNLLLLRCLAGFMFELSIKVMPSS